MDILPFQAQECIKATKVGIRMTDLTDLIGKPFKDGGRGPDSYDCYGLAKEVYHRYGIELPDYTVSCKDASKIDETVATEKKLWIEIDRESIIVPTLVVMRFNYGMLCNHTGVYIGGDRIIHTINKKFAHIININDTFWNRKIAGFYIHPEQLEGK